MSYSLATLLVEDQRSTAMVVSKILARIGFEHVDVAHDGEAALQMLRGSDYGLVVSDWHMKPMSGIDLLGVIRAEWRFRHMRFIMTSVDWSVEAIGRARQSGVDAYLLKPFNARMLKERIDAVIL